MAKSKLDPLGEGSKKAKEFQEIMGGAKVTLEEFIAANTKMSQELQSVTQQSSAFFQLAAEGASKAASEMKNVSDSSATTSQNIDSLTGAIVKQGKAFEKANKEAGFKKGGDGKNNVFEQLGKSSKVAKAGVIALGGAFNLLGKAVKGVTSIIGGIFDVLSNAAGFIKSIIGGVIDLASGAFETMVRMSDQVKDRMFEAAQAIEKVKETFGNLEKGSGKEISGFVKKVMGMYSPGAMRQIFGSITEAADYALGLASSSAEMASLLSDQLDNNATKIAMFAKGLGQTTEDFKAVMDMAYTTGESIDSIQESMLKFSQGIGNRLNLNVKVLSKNLLLAAKDVKHFGKATVQSMAESAAYATRMGVSLDKIVGVLDKFDTFEDAANNVSKLSQAFGVNLDTMKLVEADTTEERIEMLKDSFNAAGKSLDSLSRRELSYAASLIGTDEATLKNVLSNKNQANSLDDIKNASAATAKQTRSTADIMDEAMKGVAMTLKKIERQSTGFFDVFLDGIAEGIFLSGPFQKVLANLAMALEAVFLAGKQLGMIIVSTFPGLKQMLDALAKFFDPKKIGELFGGFTTSFEKFFKNLKNGTGDVKDLFKDLFNNIKSYFIKQGPPGQEFLSGVSEFWGAVKQIIATAILGIGELIANMFSSIADFLETPPETSGLGQGVKGIGGKIAKSVEESPITKAAQKAFEKIAPQFDRIWTQIKIRLEKGFDDFINWLGKRWEAFDLLDWMSKNPGTAAVLGLIGIAKLGGAFNFASSVINAGTTIGKLFAGGFGSAAGPMVSQTFTTMTTQSGQVATTMTKQFASVGTSMTSMLGPVAAIAAAAAALTLAYSQAKSFYAENSDLIKSLTRGGRESDEIQAQQQANRIGELEKVKNESLNKRLETLRKVTNETKTQIGVTEKIKAMAGVALENPLETAGFFASAIATGGLSLVAGVAIANEQTNVSLVKQLAKDEDARYELLSNALRLNPEDSANIIKQQQDTVNEFLSKVRAADMGVITALEEEANKSETVRQFTVEELMSGVEIGGKRYQISDQDMIKAFMAKRNLLALQKKGASGLSRAGFDAAQQAIQDALDQAKRTEDAKKEGEKLMQDAASELGLTTVDNVEERMKKISELSKSISGSKDAFEADMKKVRDTLKTMNFSLFETAADRDKFATALGDINSITAFQTAINKFIVSIEDTGKTLVKLGSSAESGSILSNYLISLGSLVKGLRDLYVMFSGGKLLSGVETDGLAAAVTGRDMASFDVAAVGVELHAAFIRDLNVSIDKLAKQLIETDVNLSLVSAVISSGNLFSNLQALGILMGGVNSEEGLMSISDMLGTPEDMTTTAEAIKKWTTQSESMFDSLGKSLEKMDKSLAVVDELKKKIASVTELRQQLDSAMQSLNEERTISVQTGAPDSKGSIAAKPKPEKIQTSMGVNMTLKFDIIMDAKSLETAVVTRSDSIVLNALKLLADGTNKVVQESPGYNIFVNKKS